MRKKINCEKIIKISFILCIFALFFSAAPVKAADDLLTNPMTLPAVTPSIPDESKYQPVLPTTDSNAILPPSAATDPNSPPAGTNSTGVGTTPSSTTTTTSTNTEENKDAGLELVYPEIPGAATPQYISVGIPKYVEYLFKLAVWGIGIIIFLVLLYQGFMYFTSAGNPQKYTDAIDGIKSAGLGAIILLSAYLIFNTIKN